MSFLSGVDDSNYDPVVFFFFLSLRCISFIGVYNFIKWRNSQELKFVSTLHPLSQSKVFIKQNSMIDIYSFHTLKQHRDGQ